MNKDELKEASERCDYWTRWNPKEAKISPPSSQQTSDEFIAQGGKCIYGKPLDFSKTRASRKTGFLFQSYLR